MASPFIQTSLANGEISPSLFGHTDLVKYHSAASTMRNVFVDFRGGGRSRAGTAYVGRSKQRPDLGDPKPRLIGYQFSLPQGEVLEFGEHYIRFIIDGGYVLEASKAISSATQANPCAVGCVGNGFSNGDWVFITGVVGMTELNGNTYIVADAATDSFTLQDLDGNPLDSSAYHAYVSGGTAARVYTIVSPYVASDLPALKYAQSADVMSLTHPSYPPQELSRLGATNWTIAPADFNEPIISPMAVQALATVNPNSMLDPPTLPAAFAYVVTSVDPVTGRESTASPIGNVTDSVDIAQTAGSIIVAWGPVNGAQYYNIYRAPTSYNTDPGSATNALPVPVGSLFGFVGSSYGSEFVDSNIVPDFAQSPPSHKNPFAPGQIIKIIPSASSADWTTATVAVTTSTGSGFVGEVVIAGAAIVGVIVLNAGQDYQSGDAAVFTGDGTSVSSVTTVGSETGTYPSLVTYYQQRRVYAAAANTPDTYNMSQPGAFLDFDSTIPVNDSDAITGTPWSEQVNGLQWMVSMPSGLLTFTGSGVWQVGASGSFGLSSPSAITPANQIAVPQSSIGSSPTVPPIRVNWDVLYLQAKGYTIRDLTYQIYFNTFTGTDISWQSSHLLIGYTLEEWAWCEEPYRVLWAARNDGALISMTYLREQEVNGMARHTTQGQVRGVCTVTELPVDALYLVVERFVGNSSRFFIERMNNRIWPTCEDEWCVDSAVSLSQDTPAAILFADKASGEGAVFFASSPVWSDADIGKVIRSGGGIAQITEVTDASNVVGKWYFPCQETVPDDPLNAPLPQPQGSWNLGTPTTTVSGLVHLAGKAVVGLADGVPVGPMIVSSIGTVTLPFPASKAVVGLGFGAQLQSVYLEPGVQPTAQGRRKAIPAMTVRMDASGLPQMGANQIDASTLTPSPLAVNWTLPPAVPIPPGSTAQPYTTPGGATAQPPFTGDLRAIVQSGWQKPGQVAVQQNVPRALNVLAFIPEVLSGDIPEDALRPQQPQRAAPQPGLRRAA